MAQPSMQLLAKLLAAGNRVHNELFCPTIYGVETVHFSTMQRKWYLKKSEELTRSSSASDYSRVVVAGNTTYLVVLNQVFPVPQPIVKESYLIDSGVFISLPMLADVFMAQGAMSLAEKIEHGSEAERLEAAKAKLSKASITTDNIPEGTISWQDGVAWSPFLLPMPHLFFDYQHTPYDGVTNFDPNYFYLDIKRSERVIGDSLILEGLVDNELIILESSDELEMTSIDDLPSTTAPDLSIPTPGEGGGGGGNTPTAEATIEMPENPSPAPEHLGTPSSPNLPTDRGVNPNEPETPPTAGSAEEIVGDPSETPPPPSEGEEEGFDKKKKRKKDQEKPQ